MRSMSGIVSTASAARKADLAHMAQNNGNLTGGKICIGIKFGGIEKMILFDISLQILKSLFIILSFKRLDLGNVFSD